MQCCSWHRSVIALLALQVFLACMNGSCGSWMLLVSLRGLCWQVSAGSTAQYDLRNCWARLPLTQGSVGLQFASLASRLVGKCHDSRLREKLPRPLSGHTPAAHKEPPRPHSPALQTLMRVCSALDPPQHISWRCFGLVAFVAIWRGSPSLALALAAAATLARKVPCKQRPGSVSRPEACRAQAPQSFGSALWALFFW